MILPNFALIRELRDLQKQKFPELRAVFLHASYAHVMCAELDSLGCDRTTENNMFRGIARITLPSYMQKEAYKNIRIGCMAHELSHLMCFDEASEEQIDYEVIKRGLGKYLLSAIQDLENRKLWRTRGYNCNQILEILKERGEVEAGGQSCP